MSSSLFYEVYKYLPNDTDLTVYKEAGLQGLNFAHAEKEPHYHTPLDNLSNLSAGTIQLHGDNVWGVLQGIKDMDLTQTERGNVIFADIAGLFVIYWQENFSIVASLFILAILALLHWHFFARDWQSHRAVLAVIAWLFISVIVFWSYRLGHSVACPTLGCHSNTLACESNTHAYNRMAGNLVSWLAAYRLLSAEKP